MSESAITFEEIAHLADTLTSRDKLRLIKRLSGELEKAYVAETPEARGWPPGFFERTAGSLADDPIERPPQGDYEVRDEIE
ncbi:MAG: hypothetical protein GC204_20195 [Chloroflexi bacterium]|nr:hypothetical protein [Chloroflexota bacterium]